MTPDTPTPAQIDHDTNKHDASKAWAEEIGWSVRMACLALVISVAMICGTVMVLVFGGVIDG